MFEKLVVGFVFDGMLAQDHPVRCYDRCINKNQIKNKCEICASVCPTGVYGGPGCTQADYSRCVNCGLCIAACPTNAIAPSAANASAYLKLLHAKEENVCIAHANYAGDAHLKVESFSVLPWAYLACLGMRKRVILLYADAPQMDEAERARWKETRVRLYVFFGKEAYRTRFTETSNAGDVQARAFTRRDMMRSAGSGIKSRLVSASGEQMALSGLLWHQLLERMMKEAGGTYGVCVPSVTQACTGCGVCSKLCPNQALEVQWKENGFRLIVDPMRCTGCGLCEKACIRRAMDGMGIVQASGGRRMAIAEKA